MVDLVKVTAMQLISSIFTGYLPAQSSDPPVPNGLLFYWPQVVAPELDVYLQNKLFWINRSLIDD